MQSGQVGVGPVPLQLLYSSPLGVGAHCGQAPPGEQEQLVGPLQQV